MEVSPEVRYLGRVVLGKLPNRTWRNPPAGGDDSRTGSKLKAQITRWANWMTEGLAKPDRRWVREMVYGIQAAEDVKLSNVGRSLGEGVKLIEVEQRLSREASARDGSGLLNERIGREGSYRVKGETVLAVDVGDLRKRYGEEMESAGWRTGSGRFDRGDREGILDVGGDRGGGGERKRGAVVSDVVFAGGGGMGEGEHGDREGDGDGGQICGEERDMGDRSRWGSAWDL